ncbi:MAG: flagellar hook-associated protein FlgL [Burkholderiaceae bacterium]|nr:flagellar hook-associated protein FlgL [Burkholderiaceae bacterium]
MRVSTSMAFDRAIDSMNERQAKLVRSQEELSTGRRVLLAGDDPMAAADAERMRSQLRRIETAQRMNQFAQNLLGNAEATLASVNETMQTLREGFVQAGNGAIGGAERALLAAQFRGYREQLFALANSPDAAGGFVFGGLGSSNAPFELSGSVVYTPNTGQQQVGLGADVPVSVDGRQAFMSVPGPSGNTSIFDIVDAAIAVLEDQSAPTATVTAAIRSALEGLDGAMEKVMLKRTEIGEQLRAIDSRTRLSESNTIEVQARLSQLQDLDFAKAISEFQQNQTALSAAMRTYSEISRMSLFDYL